MRKRIGKLLIGFVIVAIFIGVAETTTDYEKRQNKLKREASNQLHKDEIHFNI